MTNNDHDTRRHFDGTWVEREVTALEPLGTIPSGVLDRQVRRHGRCLNEPTIGEPPDPPTGESHPDRWLAERLCHGCPVQRACLEAEPRKNGENTTGVWGGLSDDDRRALVAQWEAHPQRARQLRSAESADNSMPRSVEVIAVETTAILTSQHIDAVHALATLIDIWSVGSDHSSRATVDKIHGGSAS